MVTCWDWAWDMPVDEDVVEEVEGWVDVSVSMLEAPVPLLLLLVPFEFVFAFEFELALVAELEHPNSSYNFPVEESYFMALYPRNSDSKARGHDQWVDKYPKGKNFSLSCQKKE